MKIIVQYLQKARRLEMTRKGLKTKMRSNKRKNDHDSDEVRVSCLMFLVKEHQKEDK